MLCFISSVKIKRHSKNTQVAGGDKKPFKCFELICPCLPLMNLGMFSFFIFALGNGDTSAAVVSQRNTSSDI